MATRLYPNTLSTYGTAPSAAGGAWTTTTGFATGGLSGAHISHVGGNPSAASGTVNPTSRMLRMYMTPPLQAQTIASGTIKGQFRCSETASGNNAQLAFALSILKSDGTVRSLWIDVQASDDNTATPPEMVVTTLTNRKLRDVSENVSISLSSVDVEDGDRIALELGFKAYSTSNQTITIQVWNGTTFTPELAEDDTTTTDVPCWVEFSQDIRFKHPFYVRSSAIPADSASATNATSTITLTPPTNMRQGDLVVAFMQSRNSATMTVGVTGGQTWNSLTALNDGSNINTQCFWCVFNGTWSASPRFDSTSSTCTSAHMSAFRGRTINENWILYATNTRVDGSAGSHAVLNSSNLIVGIPFRTAVSIYTEHTDDDNTHTYPSGADLAASDWTQWRNTSGSDQSLAVAVGYHSTGSVIIDHGISWTLATLGPDPAVLYQLAFAAVDEIIINMPPLQPPIKERSITSGVNVSG